MITVKRFFCSTHSAPNLLYRKAKTVGKSVDDLKTSKIVVPGFKGEALYGTFPVLEALMASKRQFYRLYMKDSVRKRAVEDKNIKKILETAESLNIPVKRLTQAQFDRKTEFQLHNGICLDTSPLPFTEFNRETNTLLFLDGILDPGNIGAIARTSFFFGISDIVLRMSRCPNTITPAMSKASCGAIEHLNISKIEDQDIEKNLKDFTIVGTVEPEGRTKEVPVLNIEDFKIEGQNKLALVLGDEGGGISAEVKNLCNRLVTIPGNDNGSNVNSLNVSVAAGIFLQHLHLYRTNQRMI